MPLLQEDRTYGIASVCRKKKSRSKQSDSKVQTNRIDEEEKREEYLLYVPSQYLFNATTGSCSRNKWG